MGKTYDQRKDQVAGILREQSKAGRDIAPLPKVKNRKRRESCRENLRLFCETYFPNAFYMNWSDDHLRVIQIIQDATRNGGLFAVAMPRGNGKTTLCVVAAIWTLLYGHRSYVVLIGATETHAVKLLKNVMTHFEVNPLLLEDFPEVCYPIKRLDRIAHRATGQLLNGQSTRIGWTSTELILPTVPNSVASGARVAVAGLTGAVHGLQATQADGTIIRPDFVLLDDPQTKESAHSPKQVADRLDIINADVLGLAGPRKKISGVAPVTVVAKDDLADRLLDRKKNPEWQGIKTKLLKSEPKDLKAWEKYAEIWGEALRQEKGLAPATAYYLANRATLDDGAEAAWPERFNPDEASAIQNAMNLKLRDEASYYAEYQNEPLSMVVDTPLTLTADKVAAKAVDGIDREKVPVNTTKLTAFIDVQGKCLFYAVVAWGKDFSGHVVDYQAYPKQVRNYYFLREVSPTLQDKLPNSSFEAQLYAGLDVLSKELLTKQWMRDDGETMSVSRLIIDAGYRDDVVGQFVRQSGYAGLILPSKGFGVTADKKPFAEYREEKGVRTGWNWRHKVAEKVIHYDTNSWKTFVAQRLLSNPGDPGNLSLFRASTANQHKMFAEHAASEYPVAMKAEATGRTVNEWKQRPNRENHFWDCLVGCAVAASEQGILFTGHEAAKGQVTRKRRKVTVNF